MSGQVRVIEIYDLFYGTVFQDIVMARAFNIVELEVRIISIILIIQIISVFVWNSIIQVSVYDQNFGIRIRESLLPRLDSYLIPK